MPGAAHGIADHQAVDERTVVVGAMGPDREHLRPAAHQEDLFVPDMTDPLAAVGKLRERNALRQIEAAGLGLVLGHSLSPFGDPRSHSFAWQSRQPFHGSRNLPAGTLLWPIRASTISRYD